MINQIYTSLNSNKIKTNLANIDNVVFIDCVASSYGHVELVDGIYEFYRQNQELINIYGKAYLNYCDIVFKILKSTNDNIGLYLPETELHIDLQRRLLPELEEKCSNKCIYVGTLSPIICSKYVDLLVDL